MKYRLAMFDFDGTLADSFPFFIQVFNQIAAKHGFQGIDPEQAASYRQYNPRQMMKLVGLPAWKLPFVARTFTTLMRQNAAHIPLFEQVNELLPYLAQQGVTLAIVTSNNYDNVCQILGPANTQLFSHFECGMSIFGKPARLRQVLKKTGIPRHEAIYIGDQIPDLEAARQERVAFGAVAWGYGTLASLRALSPEEEFEQVSALKRIAG